MSASLLVFCKGIVIFTVMKSTLFLFLFALLLVACGNDSSTSVNNLDVGENSSKSCSSAKIVSSSSSAKYSSSIVAKSSSDMVTEPAEVTLGSITDSRDGQTYKTVKIGSQIWMAENLNYETANSYCYNDKAANCSKYGRLYTWAGATTACPSGWHLPSQTEWETLFTAVGGSSIAGKVLKSSSGWSGGGNGTDAFGFSALLAGDRDYNGRYLSEGGNAYFWSSTEYNSFNAYYMYLYYDYDGADLYGSVKYYGFSVRCLKD